MKRVVQFSGGVGSWAAAKRVAEQHGTTDMVLLFADTNDEHADLYRFLDEASANVGVPVTRISDGRTPMQVMTDERFIGNSRRDPCSKILKRQLLDRWCRDNCDPKDTVRYIGIDYTEEHRMTTFRERILPWSAEAPMCESPQMDKLQMLEWLSGEGIAIPVMYLQGFAHNNCGGACIKAGQAQWALLLRVDRPRFLRWETWELWMRERVGDYSILRDRRGGQDKTLTLHDFRLRIEAPTVAHVETYDKHEWGGCGCAL